MIDDIKLEKLYKYFDLLTKAYFTDDPLNVKPSIEKVTLLIELEINKGYEDDE
ncbi:hypothetical protein P4V72_08505 [Bacillus thuringiensis]|uniref:hypothetical protein n=1 Tax=Bacillus TaxID=1386 RepID=UPI000A74F513|nr:MULTISPECIES: hypothetical protein [Bacillus]MEC3574229.1 hypothetical protein [Bacillus thuringiensis]MED2022261.1 hypothetical protein [Bacillus thuringiensis]MED2141243.1 hypothetical protein [Bacillus thuringiensis]MED2517641.1 hypothetical protein [Bacillus thuringiensis]MED3097688.1 hypothetical protein [Bacillus thuringiensis]